MLVCAFYTATVNAPPCYSGVPVCGCQFPVAIVNAAQYTDKEIVIRADLGSHAVLAQNKLARVARFLALGIQVHRTIALQRNTVVAGHRPRAYLFLNGIVLQYTSMALHGKEIGVGLAADQRVTGNNYIAHSELAITVAHGQH